MYTFVFFIAQVSRPGLDFLQSFKMSINLSTRRLIHSEESQLRLLGK